MLCLADILCKCCLMLSLHLLQKQLLMHKLGAGLVSLCCIVQECVIYRGADYVVVHKPAGVQVAPTVDNLLESVLFCTAQVSQAAFIMPYLEAHVPLVHANDAFSALISCLVAKNRKDYAFWRRCDQKPSVIPGCPGSCLKDWK